MNGLNALHAALAEAIVEEAEESVIEDLLGLVNEQPVPMEVTDLAEPNHPIDPMDVDGPAEFMDPAQYA